MAGATWTDIEDGDLRRLITEGAPFSLISQKMNRSRCSCIGRAQRLGIEHPNYARRDLSRTSIRSKPKAAIARNYEVRVCEPVTVIPEPIVGAGVTIIDLKNRQCRAIVGRDEETELMTYCAEPTAPGRSFCGFHHKAYFYKLPRKK